MGQGARGQTLSDTECRKLMKLPVTRFTTSGNSYGGRDGLRQPPPHELDHLLDSAEFIKRAVSDTDESRREEIGAISEKARRNKTELNRKIESLKNELRQIENALSRTASVPERVDAENGKPPSAETSKNRSNRFLWTVCGLMPKPKPQNSSSLKMQIYQPILQGCLPKKWREKDDKQRVCGLCIIYSL